MSEDENYYQIIDDICCAWAVLGVEGLDDPFSLLAVVCIFKQIDRRQTVYSVVCGYTAPQEVTTGGKLLPIHRIAIMISHSLVRMEGL